MIGARLKEERERLGLSQAEMAALGDTKPRTYQDWERGIAVVSTEFLSVVAMKIAVDLMYVLTGARSPQVLAVRPAPAATRDLSPEHEALLDNYDNADDEGRDAARRVLIALSKSKKRAA
ncbi:MAG: helix-turn-helix transcriptional regulator [Comamonas sp.]